MEWSAHLTLVGGGGVSIGLPRFNRGLGSFVMLLCNFPIGISILVGIFAAGKYDFVTFVESITTSCN